MKTQEGCSTLAKVAIGTKGDSIEVSTHYTESKANVKAGRAGKPRVTSNGNPCVWVRLTVGGNAFAGTLFPAPTEQ